MKPIRLLTVEEVLRLHEESISLYGGIRGIRDQGLLESAVLQAGQTFDGLPLYPRMADVASVYWFGINANHPFIDGNKRTALRAADVFLSLNGLDLRLPPEDAVVITLRLISRELSREGLVALLEDVIVPH